MRDYLINNKRDSARAGLKLGSDHGIVLIMQEISPQKQAKIVLRALFLYLKIRFKLTMYQVSENEKNSPG